MLELSNTSNGNATANAAWMTKRGIKECRNGYPLRIINSG